MFEISVTYYHLTTQELIAYAETSDESRLIAAMEYSIQGLEVSLSVILVKGDILKKAGLSTEEFKEKLNAGLAEEPDFEY